MTGDELMVWLVVGELILLLSVFGYIAYKSHLFRKEMERRMKNTPDEYKHLWGSWW